MTTVRGRARLHADRAGDPLDGLVNLFDVAVVLAVAFLLVALTALRTGGAAPAAGPGQVSVPSGAGRIPSSTSAPVHGRGARAGTVYRLENGTLVYVLSATPTPGP